MRGILFDLDGTLLDTAPDFEFCLNQLLAEEGRTTLELPQIRQVISQGAIGLMQLGFQITEDAHDFIALKERLLDKYFECLGNHTSFFPGIEKLLTKLESNKIPWGIVTNKPERFTLPLIEKIAFPSSPQCIISGDTLAYSKPHPQPITHGCKLLGIDPNRSMYVGDDHRDVLAGQAAGLACCVVHYGYIHKKDDPQKWQAQFYVDHADEIFPTFEQYI